MSDISSLLLGVHVSIAGGISKAPARASELGCPAMQIFTKNATQWKSKEIPPEESQAFITGCRKNKIRSVMAHGAYLINPAAPNHRTLAAGRRVMIEELERCQQLRIPVLIIHPGSHVGSGDTQGLETAAESICVALETSRSPDVLLAIENTAGQGTSIGHNFKHLKTIRDKCSYPDRIRIAFDTCHAFAAGYDLRSAAAYRETWQMFDDVLDLDSLIAIHVNDSRRPVGSRIDRHWHIGEGELGLETFWRLLNDDRFADIPKILETPKMRGEKDMDPVNLKILRQLAEKEMG